VAARAYDLARHIGLGLVYQCLHGLRRFRDCKAEATSVASVPVLHDGTRHSEKTA
jgi:hypothetical protein